MVELNRRRFCKLGATSAAIALAGCLGPTNSPSYQEWIPADGERILTAYIDLTLTEKTSRIDPLLPLVVPAAEESAPSEFVPDLSWLDRVDDPLLRLPLQTGGRILSLSSVYLAFAGLGDLIDLAKPTQGVTELFRANNTVVGTGDIDVDEADEALRSGTRGAFGENRFDIVSESGDYTYYEPVGDISGGVAINDSAVLVAESLAAVQAVTATHDGETARATEADETFDWLSQMAGHGDVAVGWMEPLELSDFYWGSEDPSLPSDIVSKQDNVVSSVAFSPAMAEISAEFALQERGLADAKASRLENELGTSAEEVSRTVAADRIAVTGTYTDDVLDIDFEKAREPTETTPSPDDDEVPAAVAEAVPENAFEFVYKEAMNRVRVNLVGDFQADKVTVSTTESESETSISSPGTVTFVTVSVDPAGDEVLVSVTVDGESGVVARKTVP